MCAFVTGRLKNKKQCTWSLQFLKWPLTTLFLWMFRRQVIQGNSSTALSQDIDKQENKGHRLQILRNPRPCLCQTSSARSFLWSLPKHTYSGTAHWAIYQKLALCWPVITLDSGTGAYYLIDWVYSPSQPPGSIWNMLESKRAGSKAPKISATQLSENRSTKQ